MASAAGRCSDAGFPAGRSSRKLLFAFVLTAAMMAAEAFGGLWSGSLALLAAGLAGLGLALGARRRQRG